MIGSSEDDLKLLVVKGFVIPFESGVIVITAWRVNNLIRKDWYNETIFKEEKSLLSTLPNGEYSLVNENVPNSLTQVRLGKVSLVKNKKETNKEKKSDETKEQEFERLLPEIKAELLATTFSAYREKQVKDEVEVAADWVRSKGAFQKYKNWTAFFRNWLRRAVSENKFSLKPQRFEPGSTRPLDDPKVQALIGKVQFNRPK